MSSALRPLPQRLAEPPSGPQSLSDHTRQQQPLLIQVFTSHLPQHKFCPMFLKQESVCSLFPQNSRESDCPAFFKKKKKKFLYWLYRVLAAAHRIFPCSEWSWSALWCSACGPRGLSCPEACGILVPRPEIESVPPALQGGFLTTGPRGKPLAPPSLGSKHGVILCKTQTSTFVPLLSC